MTASLWRLAAEYQCQAGGYLRGRPAPLIKTVNGLDVPVIEESGKMETR